jgi:hypothetical protein
MLQTAPLQQQALQLENQARQMDIGTKQAMAQAWQNVTTDENGHFVLDHDKVLSNIPQGPYAGMARMEISKSLNELNKSGADYQKTLGDVDVQRRDLGGAYGNYINTVLKQANGNPDLLAAGLAHGAQLFPDQGGPVLQRFQQNPQDTSWLRGLADGLIASSPKYSTLAPAQSRAETAQKEYEAKLPGGPLYAPALAGKGEAARLGVQLSPEVQAAETGLAGKKAQAEAAGRTSVEFAPGTVQAYVNRAVQVQRATEAGSNAALAGVPPRLVTQATSAADKADSSYSTTLEANQNLKSFLDLAAKGNKVAYAYSPVDQVLTINVANQIKRVNMAEISAFGGAGSAWDRIVGYFGKQASGASIPPDVLKDMGALQQTLEGNATTKYQRDLKMVNSRFGSNFQPVDLSQTPTGGVGGGAGAPAGGGMIYARDAQGHGHNAPAGTPLPPGWTAVGGQ